MRFVSVALLLVLAACQLPVAPPWRTQPAPGLYTISSTLQRGGVRRL